MSGIISDNKSRSSGLVKAGAGGVPTIAGDKSPATAGDIWYNSSTTELRCYLPVAAWSAGGNLGESNRQNWGSGTQTAALVAGGDTPASDDTQEYNGSSWASTNATVKPAGGSHTMAGTQTSTLLNGGNWILATSETYDGSCWTAGTDTPGARYSAGGFGASATSKGVVGGWSGAIEDDTWTWDGSSWSAVGLIPQGRYHFQTCGIVTAALAISGSLVWPTHVAEVDIFDGTSWSDTGNNYPLSISQGAAVGSTTDCFVAGGHDQAASPAGTTDKTYTYDGSSWSAGTAYPDDATQQASSCGVTSTSAFAMFGGKLSGSDTNLTYEWTDAVTNATITTSA
jgi:hypothetical protein